jgi:hypothetical protein
MRRGRRRPGPGRHRAAKQHRDRGYIASLSVRVGRESRLGESDLLLDSAYIRPAASESRDAAPAGLRKPTVTGKLLLSP